MITHPTAQELVAGVATWLPIDGSASVFGLRVARFHGDGPLRLVLAHTDISERRIAEERLRDGAR